MMELTQADEADKLRLIVDRFQAELTRADYGDVTLSVTMHAGRIVRFGITRNYTSKLVRVSDPRGSE